jgi:hypothetical protein
MLAQVSIGASNMSVNVTLDAYILFALLAVVSIGSVYLAGRIAQYRGRSFKIWAWIAAFIGPLALPLVLLLPILRDKHGDQASPWGPETTRKDREAMALTFTKLAVLAGLAILTLGVIPDRRKGAVIAIATCVVAAIVLHFAAPWKSAGGGRMARERGAASRGTSPARQR